MRHLFSLIVLWAAASLGVAQGAEILRLDVGREGDNYRLSLETRLRVPEDAVWRTLTDYTNLHRLSEMFRESEVLGQADARTHLVRMLFHVCVMMYCRDIHHTQVVRQVKNGLLLARTQPERSDFEFGVSRWRLYPDPAGTLLRFETELRPSFWTPPLIGPWAIKRALLQDAEATANGLETLARLR